MKTLSLSLVSSLLLLIAAKSASAVERLAFTCKNAVHVADDESVVNFFRDTTDGSCRAELTRITFFGGNTYELADCVEIDPRISPRGSIQCNDGKNVDSYSIVVAVGGQTGVGNATLHHIDHAGKPSKLATLVCRYRSF